MGAGRWLSLESVTLINSWETMPPSRAPVECSSAPPTRHIYARTHAVNGRAGQAVVHGARNVTARQAGWESRPGVAPLQRGQCRRKGRPAAAYRSRSAHPHTASAHHVCSHRCMCAAATQPPRPTQKTHPQRQTPSNGRGAGGGVTSVGPRPELPSNNAWYSARSKGTSVVGASAVPHPACLPCFARKFSAERSIRYLRREGSDI